MGYNRYNLFDEPFGIDCRILDSVIRCKDSVHDAETLTSCICRREMHKFPRYLQSCDEDGGDKLAQNYCYLSHKFVQACDSYNSRFGCKLVVVKLLIECALNYLPLKFAKN